MDYTASEINRMMDELKVTGTVIVEDYYDSLGNLCRRLVPYERWLGDSKPARENPNPNKLFKERNKL